MTTVSSVVGNCSRDPSQADGPIRRGCGRSPVPGVRRKQLRGRQRTKRGRWHVAGLAGLPRPGWSTKRWARRWLCSHAGRASGRSATAPGPLGACGDLAALFTQDPADRLDRSTFGSPRVDEFDDHRLRGSANVGLGRGDSRCGCVVFRRSPNPGCTFQCTGLSSRPGHAAVSTSSSVSGQGAGMAAPGSGSG